MAIKFGIILLKILKKILAMSCASNLVSLIIIKKMLISVCANYCVCKAIHNAYMKLNVYLHDH